MRPSNVLYREFGLVLATERKRLHLSQQQFGTKVGLSRTSVTNIECGRQPVQLHQLYLFAATLKIDVAKLLPKEAPIMPEPSKAMGDKGAQYLADLSTVLSKRSEPKSRS